MPRIAATLGVFGLVVLALGLNMAQFPMEYRVAAPSAESARTEGSFAADESNHMPTVALRTAEKEPQNVYQEPTATVRDEPAETVRELVSTGEEHQPQQEAEQTGPYSDDAREPDPRPDLEAQQEPEAQYTGDATGVDGVLDQMADAIPTTTSQAPSDPADTPTEPAGQYANGSLGGIYNPLEPEPPRVVGPPETGQLPYQDTEGSLPAAAVPSPPYAAAGSTSVTAGRSLVPIDQNATGESSEPSSAAQAIRLPAVDNVWPGVPTDVPPIPGGPPAEGYPTTSTP